MVSFRQRLDEGRARLNLIAQEVARAVHVALQEFGAANRKLRTRPPKDVQDDIAAQLQRLVPKRFVLETPLAAAAVPAALPESHHQPARQAARRPGPRRC